MRKIHASLAFLIALAATLGCGGGSNRQLQSITANATGMIQFQFTATGALSSSPTSVSPLPVSWWVLQGVVLDPPYPYTLSNQPLLVACQTGGSVVAIAPASPNASSTGTIPAQVFQDLIHAQTGTSEDGFVVSAQQTIACP